jgi:hypothetical protein
LRRRRNQIEYPAYPGDVVEVEEVTETLEVAGKLVASAEKLLPNLGLFA